MTTQQHSPTHSKPNFQDRTVYPLIEVDKQFEAPIEKIWQILTTEDFIKQWWGPKDYTCPVAEIKPEKGGKYLFAMKSPEGETMWTTGNFLEWNPPQKMVFTDFFADESGKQMSAEEAGIPNWTSAPDLRITITLKRVGPSQTKLHLEHEGISQDMHNDCSAGWSESLDKIRSILQKN